MAGSFQPAGACGPPTELSMMFWIPEKDLTFGLPKITGQDQSQWPLTIKQHCVTCACVRAAVPVFRSPLQSFSILS